MNLFRVGATSQVESRAIVLVGGNILEYLGLLAPHVKLGSRTSVRRTCRRSEQEENNAAGLRVGQRPEQYRIHNRKNRAVGSDTDPERGQRRGGERRVLAHR